MKLSALREQRSAKVAAMKNLVDKAGAESRDLSADEIKQFDALKAEERTLGEQIERAEYLQEVERRAMGEPVSSNAATDFDKLAGGVSVVKVIRAQMEGRSLDGAEGEYAKEAERRSGRKAEGAFVPMRALETRADGVNTTATAPQIIPTVHRADQYIEPLRDRLLARQLGVRVLTGLSGNIVIPKFGSGLTLGWVGENEAIPEGEMTFGNVNLSPKHTGGKTEMSRQLIQQSSPGIEQLVRDDLSYLVAKAIDLALINGTGTKQPVGVLNAPGTQAGTLASATWAGVLALPELLELVNSMPDGLGVDEILDSYVKAKEDALALAEQDDALILLTNTETKKKVLFRKQPEYEIELNEEFVGDFHDIEIPHHDVDFDKALRREGIEPTPRPVYDLGPAPEVEKKKKKRAVNFERMNVTNAHMPELFKAEQVDRLDG